MRRLLLVLLALLALTATPASALPPDAVYGVFASSTANKGTIASVGFNTVTTGPYTSELDAANARGLGGVVWLGGYVNEPTCQFAKSDSWIREKVMAIRNHPAVRGYQIDNEPHATQCPNAPAQIAARAALVRRLDPDPAHVTLLALYRDYEFDDYAGATDVLRVGSYPCSHRNGCVYSKIPNKVAAARAAGWTRLWGSPQAFGDDYYRMPTASELRTILDIWEAQDVEGLLAYVWDKSDPDTLSMHPALWPVFADS
jgi:hypothetical protein